MSGMLLPVAMSEGTSRCKFPQPTFPTTGTHWPPLPEHEGDHSQGSSIVSETFQDLPS